MRICAYPHPAPVTLEEATFDSVRHCADPTHSHDLGRYDQCGLKQSHESSVLGM